MRFHQTHRKSRTHPAHHGDSMGNAIERLIGREGIDIVDVYGFNRFEGMFSEAQAALNDHTWRDIKVDKYPLGMMIRCDRVCHLVGMLLCEHYTLSHGQTQPCWAFAKMRRAFL